MNSLKPIVYRKPTEPKLVAAFLNFSLALFGAIWFSLGAAFLLIPSWRQMEPGITTYLSCLAAIPAGAWFGITGVRWLSRSLGSIRRPVTSVRLDETGILIGNGDDETNFKLFLWSEGPVASVKGDDVNPFLKVSVGGENGGYSATVGRYDTAVHPNELLAEFERFHSVYAKNQ